MADLDGDERVLGLFTFGGGAGAGQEQAVNTFPISDAALDGNQRAFGLGSGGSDVGPPTFVVVSPAEGTPIQPDTVLVVEIEDNVSVALAPLYAEFAGQTVAEMVYNGTALLAPYAALSTVLDLGNGGRRLSLRRTGGWPGDVNLTCIATDTSGNEVA